MLTLGVSWLRCLRRYLLLLVLGSLLWEALHMPLYSLWNGGTWREILAFGRTVFFAAHQIEHCLGAYADPELGNTRQALLALGRRNPNDASESFDMAYLAIRGSAAVNGVSRLHGEVSRALLAPLFPRRPVHEVPVDFITNGVHTPNYTGKDERLTHPDPQIVFAYDVSNLENGQFAK